MGITFPEEVRASYAIHDGQIFGEGSEPNGYGIFGSKEFFCLQNMVEDWQMMKRLLDAGTFALFQSFPDPQIEPVWWSPEWIPITHDGCANNTCLDMGPSALGNTGQIISFWHDSSERQVIARSYSEWLSNFADDLEAGEYVCSDEYGGIAPYGDVYD